MSLVLNDLRRFQRIVSETPKLPDALMAHHSVPYGRSYRQWRTDGRLIVWVNRGMVAEFTLRPPRLEVDGSLSLARGYEALVGIPVINA